MFGYGALVHFGEQGVGKIFDQGLGHAACGVAKSLPAGTLWNAQQCASKGRKRSEPAFNHPL